MQVSDTTESYNWEYQIPLRVQGRSEGNFPLIIIISIIILLFELFKEGHLFSKADCRGVPH